MLSKKQSIRAPFHNLLSLLSACLGKIHHKIVLYLPCSLPAWEKFTTKLSCTCPALYLPGKNSPQNCLVLALLSTCLGKIHHKIALHLPSSIPALGKIHHKIALHLPSSIPALGKIHHKIALNLPCSLPAWEKFTTKLSYTCPALYLPGKNSLQNCLVLALLSTCLGKIHHKIVLHLPSSIPALGKIHHKIALNLPCSLPA